MFFSSWTSLLRLVVIGVPLYVGLVAFLRISGKRTLAKMNAFDLVVTVALGSVLATALLSKQTALVDGLAAFALLILLQYVITWSSVRSPRFRKLVKNRPRLLAYRGELHAEALRRERIDEDELAAALRDSGLADVEAADAVIIETDGTISVIPRREQHDSFGALEHVVGMPENPRS
ncbi:MAG TPA: YetF domain-containing protein [Enhygromyxa sp.]|nr:YetF domain-containing protein [Enhygromyxa sp.]